MNDDMRVADVGRDIAPLTGSAVRPPAHRRPPIPSLDGLRAIAVLIVLVAHAGLGDVVPGGFGVTIFFCLSGYLITTLLLDEHADSASIGVGRFYQRRAYRLLPSLVVTLVVAYSLMALDVIGGGFSWGGLGSQLFYFANYHEIFFFSPTGRPQGTGILWSLAVEEHFYIVFPIAMAVLLRVVRDRRVVALGFAVACAVALAWRWWLVFETNAEPVRTYYASDTRFDSILFGCILAVVFNPARPEYSWLPSGDTTLRVRDGAILALAIAAILASFVVRDPGFRETLRYSVQGVALMPILYYAVRSPEAWPFRLLGHPVMRRVGVLSYGIYLIHMVAIFAWTGLLGELPAPVLIALTLVTSIGFASSLDRWVEPVFRRRRAALR